MDGAPKRKKKVQNPPLPIKTYKWEDVRRSRRKGGYPWTYLYKEPFNEEVDPEEFTMDAFRKSKSSSTLGKDSEGVTIEEMSDVDTDKENTRPPSSQDGGHLKTEGKVELADSSGEDNISQYLDKDERENAIEEVKAGPSKEFDEDLDITERKRAQSEEPKRKRKLSIDSSYSRISLSRLGLMKKLREAKTKLENIKMPSLPKLPKIPSFKKSEKPKISKSKKEAEDIVKSSLSKKAKVAQQPQEDVKPVYIYIPLKPPPGETDEFSKFATEIDELVEGKKEVVEEKKEKTEKTEEEEAPSSPDTPGSPGVQLIILTAPSDDEILDGPDIPETPSEVDSKDLYRERFEEMKNMAKDIIEEISPSREQTPVKDDMEGDIEDEVMEEDRQEEGDDKKGKKGKKLSRKKRVEDKAKETKDLKKDKSVEALKTDEGKDKVSKPDESKSDKASKSNESKDEASKTDKKVDGKAVDVVNKTDDEKVLQTEEAPAEGMMVDEEDGLKLSEAALQMINEEMQKELAKTQGQSVEKDKEPELQPILKTEPSPKPKKKVSFKRKLKSDYEEIEGKEKGLETTQSMSVDEEKTYLDEQKIMKTTSLEEDYNKWSKLGDHEYEPVNPPPEEGAAPQKGMEAGILKKLSSEESQTTDDQLSAQELQNRMEDQFFKQAPKSQTQPGASTSGGKAKFASIIKAAKAQASQPKPSILKQSPAQPSTSKEQTPENKEDTLSTKEKLQGHGRRIKAAFSTQAGRFKTRMQNIKKPTLSTATKAKLTKLKPKKPNLKKPQLPKLSMPKMPEKMSFTLPKRGTKKTIVETRQYSTESNEGDTKKKLFDFGTVPRMFSKRKESEITEEVQFESNTVPRMKKQSKWVRKLSDLKTKAIELPSKKKEDSKKAELAKAAKEKQEKKDSPVYIRIPLHSQESMDKEEGGTSKVTYNQDIDVDEYEKENKEIHKLSQFSKDYKTPERWKHGTFHQKEDNQTPKDQEENLREYGRSPFKITDLDNSNSESLSPDRRYNQSQSPNMHSSSSFGDIHQRGVLEEINSDEFFLRQKGISQDNIEVGAYLSSEIREAFKDPTNSLQQMGYDDSFDKEGDVTISDQSPEGSPKRKPIRKPKRKKTPSVSKEKLSFEQESELDDGPRPARPKRRSKKKKKPTGDDVVPYQETIHVDEPHDLSTENILHKESQFYLKERRSLDYTKQVYENEQMEGIEQPEIMLTDPYNQELLKRLDLGFMDDDEEPNAPPRKQRSLRSLNASEHDSILEDFQGFRDMHPHHPDLYQNENFMETGENGAPIAPRRTRSRTRSQSRTTSQPDEDLMPREEAFMYENQQPCVEEPCMSDLRDCMGYAIIDKKQTRDPPLPPSRFPPTPPRRRKGKVKKIETTVTETKFSTVPRSSKDPQKPDRNYSTLGSPSKKLVRNLTDEEKENVDISQYIEIEEPRDLQSGEVIQKMKDRPLPAPPRPPRKPRGGNTKALSDITNGNENIEETEVSTQTEPLPDDFVCEELVEETTDRVIIPSQHSFDNQETITHGSLVIERIEDEIIPDYPLEAKTGKAKVIPITKQDDYDETSEVPEEFHSLKDPVTHQPQKDEKKKVEEEKPPERVPRRKESLKSSGLDLKSTEVELLKASKLQVDDLDVNRLTVNELLASKIKVSEIDSGNINVSEINSQGGNLVVSGIELPPSFLKELMDKLQEQAAKDSESGQKKTPIERHDLDEVTPIPLRPPRRKSELDLDTLEDENPYEEIRDKRNVRINVEASETLDDNLDSNLDDSRLQPERPPRQKKSMDISLENLVSCEELRMEQPPELPTYQKPLLERLESEFEIENEEALLEHLRKKHFYSVDFTEDPLDTQNAFLLEEQAMEIVDDIIGEAVREVNNINSGFPQYDDEEPTFGELEAIMATTSTSREVEDVVSPPVRPARKHFIPVEKLMDIESQIINQLEGASPPTIPKRPTTQDDVYDIDTTVLKNIQNEFVKEVKQKQLSSNKTTDDNGQMEGETSEDIPPRPPQPLERDIRHHFPYQYMPSQPPPSFYDLRSPIFVDFIEDDDIPMPPRRRKQRSAHPPSESSSEEAPTTSTRRRQRTPEPSIVQLTGQLTRACGTAIDRSLKRLIMHITNSVLANSDGKQDLHVFVVMLLVLIAGLILLGWGDGKTIHHHHWEYFNPPKDL